ncbi:MAG: hypothetical protein HZA46_02110 [Planctomycetales bacterium]|nr:hypothetical protein [Planctomycetales bacterium]
MAVHRIHLKGPWQYEPLRRNGSAADSDELPPPGHATMPCTWQQMLGEFRGVVRFVRPFHRPTNLDSDERVFVIFLAVGGQGEVRLDGLPLGRLETRDGPQAADITDHLRPDMHLTIDLEFDSPDTANPGGLWGPVALEIRRTGGEMSDISPTL